MMVITRSVIEGSDGSGELVRQALVEIVDFENYLLTFCLERSKVVFLVRVVGVTKIVIHRDGFDYALDS
jgi:hypothetical protein